MVYRMYDIKTSEQGKDVIISGREVSGICEAIKIGLSKLPTLDPCKDISPIEENIDFCLHCSRSITTYPDGENLNVNSQDEDSDEDSDWEGEKNLLV